MPHPDNQRVEAVGRSYWDDNGCEVFVGDGIGKGSVWMTLRRKPGAMGTHLVISPLLPVRSKREYAQTDLDRYAWSKGWKPCA